MQNKQLKFKKSLLSLNTASANNHKTFQNTGEVIQGAFPDRDSRIELELEESETKTKEESQEEQSREKTIDAARQETDKATMQGGIKRETISIERCMNMQWVTKCGSKSTI